MSLCAVCDSPVVTHWYVRAFSSVKDVPVKEPLFFGMPVTITKLSDRTLDGSCTGHTIPVIAAQLGGYFPTNNFPIMLAWSPEFPRAIPPSPDVTSKRGVRSVRVGSRRSIVEALTTLTGKVG